MKKYFLLIVSSLIFGYLSFAVVSSQAETNNSNPIELLQSVADQMITGLKDNKITLKENPKFVYSLANKIIVPHADLDEMSKRVLPPQTWSAATLLQRQEFKNEFTTLLVRTYASALAEYKDQTIRFYPVRGGYVGQSAIKVSSQIIRTDGPSISVVYSLVLKNNEWQLYDMTVEGVSMLASFRSQFTDQLAKGDIAGLISVLKKHNSAQSGE